MLKRLIICSPDNRPDDLDPLAQCLDKNSPDRMKICGYSAADGYIEVDDIPAGYMQLWFPAECGLYMTAETIMRLRAAQAKDAQIAELEAERDELAEAFEIALGEEVAHEDA